jgi:hypothetical protein
MKKHISESLPERKHAPAAAVKGGGKTDEKGDSKGGKTPEARVKQAVYDIRYRARREELPLPQAFSQYMQNSSMGQQERALVKQKLFGKGGMKAEDFNMVDAASSNVANALYKVFVEGVGKEEPIVLTYMEKLETAEHRKYKVRVEDKNGRSYVRYATREKINALRLNPNIESVEMTGYGEPYEGERRGGKQTAAAKAGKDYDGDGEIESGAKEYRGVVHNAIQRKKGGKPDGQDTSSVKEQFLGEVSSENLNPDTEEPEIDVMQGKNTVKINPELAGSQKNTMRPSMQFAHYDAEGEVIADGYSKFLGMLQEKKMTKASKKKEKKLKTKYDPSGMKASMIQQYGPEKGKEVYFATIRKQAMKEEDEKPKMDSGKECDDDPRSLPTKKRLIASKFQSMGVKNPIVMVAGYEPEGRIVDEGREGWSSVGREDGNRRPRYRDLGGGTPDDITDQENRGNAAASAAVATLRAKRAAQQRAAQREAERRRREGRR